VKTNELRDLSLQELEMRTKELSEDLFNLKIRHSLNQLDNPMQVRIARRELARVKTVLSERRGQDQQGSEG